MNKDKTSFLFLPQGSAGGSQAQVEALKQVLESYPVPAELRWKWGGGGRAEVLEKSWTDIVHHHEVRTIVYTTSTHSSLIIVLFRAFTNLKVGSVVPYHVLGITAFHVRSICHRTRRHIRVTTFYTHESSHNGIGIASHNAGYYVPIMQ